MQQKSSIIFWREIANEIKPLNMQIDPPIGQRLCVVVEGKWD